jgi:hypothetical protein
MRVPDLSSEVAVGYDYRTDHVVVSPRGTLDLPDCGSLPKAVHAAHRGQHKIGCRSDRRRLLRCRRRGVIANAAQQLADRERGCNRVRARPGPHQRCGTLHCWRHCRIWDPSWDAALRSGSWRNREPKAELGQHGELPYSLIVEGDKVPGGRSALSRLLVMTLRKFRSRFLGPRPTDCADPHHNDLAITVRVHDMAA